MSQSVGFMPSDEKRYSVTDSIAKQYKGNCINVRDYNPRAAKYYVHDAKVHDANFAFLSTALAKLHQKPYEPKYFVTYVYDIPIDVGGGFVDYTEFYTVNWSGIMNEMRNVMGNDANYIPRVNAGLNQKRVNVYTFEIAYDLRFIELEKAKKLTLQKSIEEIYRNSIIAGWDLFVQRTAYTGIKGGTGLFNSPNVMTTMIDNSAATVAHKGFKTLTDDDVVSFFNGIFAFYLNNSNMNIALLPDTILVPTFVGQDLTDRYSALYTSTLRNFLLTHNLAYDESAGKVSISILSRSDLNDMGTNGVGRIVAYKKDKDFVRLDIPYSMKHYITLPNIDKASYTSLFAGQVSEIQLPYNENDKELGVVTYWDFTK